MKPRRLFPESVPPAMVAEVFDVEGADDDTVLSSVPPPPERREPRPSRTWSRPPAPHPPHPARPSTVPSPVDDASTLELPSDELEEDTPARTSSASRARGAWLALGVALLAGLAFGVHSCARARASDAPLDRARAPHAASPASDLR